jgi:addiction module HigA family antidote
MVRQITNEYLPDRVTRPGDTLADTLAALGMDQKDLAERIGRTSKAINEVVRGRTRITPEMALQLERATGVPASFWNNRQRRYEEHQVRLHERQALERHADWFRNFPHREMVRLNWLEGTSDKVDRIARLLDFFGVSSPDAWEVWWNNMRVQYRKSENHSPDYYALAAWLRRGELMAQDIRCEQYDADRFKRSLNEIRALTIQPLEQFVPRIKELCASCGVAAVFVPALPKTASGATRWLSSEKALVQLSFRYDSDDQFWFSFFHEAGHILLHRKKSVFLEGGDAQNVEEQEANDFAMRILDPGRRLDQIVADCRPTGRIVIRTVARELGIAPGIIVGQLQRKRKLRYSDCNDLKRRLSWV